MTKRKTKCSIKSRKPGTALYERSDLEKELESQLRALKIKWVAEYRFTPFRKWRFDFCFPAAYVAAEVEGGTWGRSRHTTGAGFQKDCEKYNAATLMGWRVLRFTSRMVKDGTAVAQIVQMLATASSV